MNPQCPVRKRIAISLVLLLACCALEAMSAPPQPEARRAFRPAASAPRPGAPAPRQAAAGPHLDPVTPALAFFTLPPCRVFDTRSADAPALAVNVPRLIQVAGKCGVPAEAKAVAFNNVTATNATAAGFIQLYAGDAPRPLTATINFPAHVTRSGNATVALASNGAGTIKAFYFTPAPGKTVDLILDVNGYYADAVTAGNDTATVAEDDPATAIDVFANDNDPSGNPLMIASVTQPANGVVVITGGGTGLTYQPNANYCNTPPGTTLDTFTYTLTATGNPTATVSMTVTCVDDPPVAVNDSATVTEDDPATAINVLANDTDIDGGPKSIASVTQPANGTVVITGGGTGLTYQPNANYCNNPPGTSPDTFTYTLTPGSSTATVSMTVNCADDPPVAVNDTATVAEDSGATAINVLANDTDIDGGPKSIASVTQPANGTVVITGGGTGLTYQPNPNYCNTPPGTSPDTFTYTLTPGSSTATVSVSVTCVDDPPVAVNDSATVGEDSGATSIDVLANDTDIDGGPKSIASVTQPANGAVAITGGGTGLTYQPNANYCNNPPGTSPDTFTYTLTPGSSTATVSVTVNCVDDPPVAVNDTATVAEDSGATSINVLANDTDVDGGPKSIASVTQPANGAVVITGGGTGLTYQPNANYCNTPPGTTPDTFTYTLTPGSSTATVSVSVTCVDDPPVAVNDTATVAEDSGATSINVLANDTDIDGGPKSIASVTQPANGTVVITGGGTGLTYQPNANYCNTPPGTTPDTFTYTLSPGGSTAMVSVSVTCVDDAPVAVNDAGEVTEDAPATAIDVLANDTDVDSGPKSIASVTQPANGTVVITGGGTGLTYQPAANYCNATFTPVAWYHLGEGDSATAGNPVSSTVDAAGSFNLTPQGNPTYSSTVPPSIGSTLSVHFDGSGDALADTAAVASTAVDNFGIDLWVKPDSAAVADSLLAYNGSPTASGWGLAVAGGNYVVLYGGVVSVPVAPVSTAWTHLVLVRRAGVASVYVNGTRLATTSAVPTTPALASGGGVSLGGNVSGGQSFQGTLDEVRFFTLTGSAPDTFTYTLTPGSSTGTVSMTVECVDDPPTAVNDSATVTEDSGATAINVLANDTDSDGGPKSIASVTQPANGTVVITGGGTGLTYQPAANYCNNPPGTTLDTFTYTLTPGGSTATVTMTVTCVDDPPVAVNDSATVTEDDPATAIPVLANDTDIDGGPKSIASVTQPANGTVVITGGGTGLTYQPNADYCNNPPGTSPDTFTYTLTPGSSTATVSVSVTCVNDAPRPIASPKENFDTIGNTQFEFKNTVPPPTQLLPIHVTGNLVANFFDIDGPGSITANGIVGCADVTAPFDCATANGGTVSLAANGEFTFTPKDGDTHASDTFQYTVTDGITPSAPRTVTINLKARVWYVKNNATAGGLGRSGDPFDTLVEAQTASSAGDYIFVYGGDLTTTGQAAGITLKANQKFYGEPFGLTVTPPSPVNGVTPVPLVTANAANRPLIGNTAAGGDGVTAQNISGIEIRGLSIGGTQHAINVNTTATNSGGATITDNVIRQPGNDGIHVAAGGSGTMTVAIQNNTVTGGSTSGISVQKTAGTLYITAFNDNVITGTTPGTGFNVNGAIFDATPGGAIDSVSGGTTAVGVSGDGVGASGMLLANVMGDLSFNALNIFDSAGTGLLVSSTGALNAGAGTGFRISVASGFGSIDSNGGPALDVNNASISLPNLTSLRSTNSTTTGVSLVSAWGGAGGTALSAPSGQISDPGGASGTAFNVNSGNGNVSFGGTISNNSGNSVVVTGRGGDTVSFSGAITDTGSGISLTSNGGTTINFTGVLSLTTGINPAFTATGGGTVTATATTSTLTTTSGTALNVNGTTIGAGGLKFQSISANGASNGITLDTTGASGGLMVSGTGSAGSGGTIQNITNRGASFINTAGVDLSWMNFTNAATTNGADPTNAASSCGDLNVGGNLGCNAPIHLVNVTGIGGNPGAKLNHLTISGSAQVGININNVTGLSLTNTTLTGIGNQVREFGLKGRNLKGTVTISGVSITGSFGENFRVENNDPSATVTVTGSTFDSSTQGGGFFFLAQDDAQVGVTISSSSFSSNFTTGLLVGVNDPASTSTCSASLDVTGGPFNNNNAGIQVINAGSADVTFNIHDIASISGNPASGIALDEADNSTSSGSLVGRIQNNTVTQPLSGSGNGIGVTARGSGTTTVAVTGNTVTNRTQYGIFLHRKEGVSPGTLNATVTGNNVSTVDVNGDLFFPIDGIRVEAGATSSDTGTLCAQISGNTSDGAQTAADNTSNFDLKLRHRFGITYRLPGLVGSTGADAINLMNTNNPAVDIIDATTTSSFTGGAACPTPP